VMKTDATKFVLRVDSARYRCKVQKIGWGKSWPRECNTTLGCDPNFDAICSALKRTSLNQEPKQFQNNYSRYANERQQLLQKQKWQVGKYRR
jgi:hypothetical protein